MDEDYLIFNLMDDLNGWIVIKCLMNEFDIKHIAIVIAPATIRFDHNGIGISDNATVAVNARKF